MALLNLMIDFRTLERAAVGAVAAGAALVKSTVLADAGMLILQKTMQGEVPVKTGKLRDSIIPRGVGMSRGLWGVGYGVYVRDGTRPHVITPKNAKMLRFVVNGQVVYARMVHHPGTKPNRFDERTVEKATPALRVLMLENGRSIVRLMASPL